MDRASPLPRRSYVGALTALGFGIAIVVGGIVGLGSYGSMRRLEQDLDARSAASQVLISLGRLLTMTLDAETGQRGYLITGDTSYLEPYRSTLSSLASETATLQQTVASDTAMVRMLSRLTPLIGRKLAELDSTIRLRRRGDLAAMRALVGSNIGVVLQDSIRAELAAASAYATEQRDLRSAEVRAGAAVMKRVIFAGGVVTVSLLSVAGFAIARQLRARAAAEDQIVERQHQLFQMLEAMPVGVFVVDANGHPFYANEKSREILGQGIDAKREVSELTEVYQAYRIGTNELYPADVQPIAVALEGRSAHTVDIEIRRPDRAVPLEVWAAPVFDAAHRLRYAIAAFADVTEREAARRDIENLSAELEQQVEELQAANQELETFSYSVSHDLRAPLRAIDGFSRMLIEDHADTLAPEARRLLDVVRTNTQRMGRLIDDLLTLSRYGRQELHLSTVDMTALASAALDDLRQSDGHARTTVTIGRLPAARGDSSLLRQVWANLLGNAVKYSRGAPAPAVAIDGSAENGRVEYRIRDNGVGFDMTYADKLFGVFQRLHSSEQFEGTGVGLATVQRIVHRHGGRVWAESRVGEGATFYFTLPAAT